MSIDTLIDERDEAEQQRDQAITERDDARRRLAEAEARIKRLQEWLGVDSGYIPYIRNVLLPGDLDPIAPDAADLRPGPTAEGEAT